MPVGVVVLVMLCGGIDGGEGNRGDSGSRSGGIDGSKR